MEWFEKNAAAEAAVKQHTAEQHQKFAERGKRLGEAEAARKQASDAAWMEKNAAAEAALKARSAAHAKRFAAEAPNAP